MNVFYLDRDPRLAAEFHCDKHVVKMILEYTQLLMGCYYDDSGILDERCQSFKKVYKLTHKNHPSSRWVRSNISHWLYVLDLAKHLSNEYTSRYGRVHACDSILHNEIEFTPANLPNSNWEDPPQCMPDDCKSLDVVEAYRNYYRTHKSKFARWKNEKIPYWYNMGTQLVSTGEGTDYLHSGS